ncbi:SRPBCC family protein [Sedimentitalea todarodis]|uniref:Polyketide cyclase n=1 Tax=Sedimentitalea todarodis TaxID=1631240 RepID=A0ABU3VN49_9RHOB|nr:hypothetical protein [Sedimentitalea todarodis]MDU9007109.1 hypothetical protein [Sedimentitalea todarodis]
MLPNTSTRPILIEHCAFIACPSQQVWAETIDIDTWPLWAPTVQSAQRLDKGAFGIGSAARI